MKTLFCVLTLACSTFSVFADKPENEHLFHELQAQEAALANELATLQAKGLGPRHPNLLTIQERLGAVRTQLQGIKIKTEDTIVFLKGETSSYLAGHPEAGKSKQVLPTLLKNGWKVQKIIPMGDDTAYVWLRK